MAESNIEHGTLIEKQPDRKPEFDGGTFVIEALSLSTEGFQVKTDKILRRREGSNPIPLNQEQKKRLRKAMVAQMKFAHGDKAKNALKRLRNSNPEEIDLAKKDYEEKRKNYLNRAVGRVGVRNLRFSDNTLTVDVKIVDFPTSTLEKRANASPELMEFATITGTTALIVTKDHRLIIQHRSPKNHLYGGVPGSSAAGFFDGVRDKKGLLKPIDTQSVIDNMTREIEEENGLKPEDISELKIVGFARDSTVTHNGFLLIGKTDFTVKEIKGKAEYAEKNTRLADEEFYENFTDIPATPQDIKVLLTKLKCPIPPGIAANFVAAGYFMILQDKGLDDAIKWKDRIEVGVRKNFQEIDEMVRGFYKKNPQELNNIHAGKSPRNSNGYDAAYLPQEQGLPDIISELKRTGLIS